MRNRILNFAVRPAAVLMISAALAGCESFLDVNENPNAPESANIDIRLPALIGSFVHSTYYGDAQLWGSEWTQQFSYNGETRSYAEVHRYELQDTDGSSAWDYYYTGPLALANDIIDDAGGENDVYYRGIARLFYAWTFAHITDMWGPVPFAEALDPTIREPRYDEQQVVYDGVHTQLALAIEELSTPGGRLPANNDLLFEGDMSRWLQLAHHVQARHHLRLAYAPGGDATARAQAALAALEGAFTSNGDDVDFIYPGGESGARNPLYTFEDLQNTLVASEHMVALLNSRTDPRIGILFTPVVYDSVRGNDERFPATTTFYRGMQNGGDPVADSTVSWIGPYFSSEDASLNVASYSDQKFTEAEARLIVSGAAAADAPYREGIRANMEKLGVASADIDAYLAARPSLASVANPLEEIITEKYIANFLKVEPWNDWRRTGYPQLEIVDGAVLPGIPERVRTPGSELSNNINQVTATGIPTGLEGMSVRVWWAEGR